jgi:hypothetical protein
MGIGRYPTDQLVTTTQNGIADALDWLGFLCAKDYLHDVLAKTHGLSAQDATRRARKIIPHVRIAREYVQQSLDGPQELAFLPAYYAMLNLSKVYVLLGPRHADLKTNRTHGVSYNVERKDSHSVLTEVITLHPKGVFPLFCETLTGRPARKKSLNLQVKEVLPCIVPISYEYAQAAGSPGRVCALQFGMVGNRCTATARDPTSGHPLRAGSGLEIPCLQGFVPSTPGSAHHFDGDIVRNPADFDGEIRRQLKTHLLLRWKHQNPHYSFTLLGPHKVEFPEEVPIWLLFFYMSSIVRYKPEFFSALKDSKYWPPISAARVHALLWFLLSFWSFVQRENYFLEAV